MTEPEDRPDDLVESVLASATPSERERLLGALLRREAASSATGPPLIEIATAPTADAVADALAPVISRLFGTDVAIVYRYDAADEAFVPASRTDGAGSDPAPVTPEVQPLWTAFRDEEPAVVSRDGDDGSSLVLPVPGIGALRVTPVDPTAITPERVALAERVASVAVGVADLKRRLENRREEVDRLREDKEQLRDFANIVSHDLRNPLSVARGYLDLAVEDGSEEYVRKVDEAHDRIEGIIEHTLALAEEGEQVGDTIPVDVETVARRAWSVVETSGATLDVVESPTIDADPDRLQQCFENLFRNSVEHGTPSSPSSADARNGASAVTVRVGPLEEGFYVEDDGPGIPPDEREQVFERGYTGDGSGTGLGLDMVREIVAGHRWSIELVASEDGGARFEIRT